MHLYCLVFLVLLTLNLIPWALHHDDDDRTSFFTHTHIHTHTHTHTTHTYTHIHIYGILWSFSPLSKLSDHPPFTLMSYHHYHYISGLGFTHIWEHVILGFLTLFILLIPKADWQASQKTNSNKWWWGCREKYTVGRNVNYCNHYENQYGDSSKNLK
jgi:hypothetical protein